jgi:hypothetical protein
MRPRSLIIGALAVVAATVALISIVLVLSSVPRFAGAGGWFGTVVGEGDVTSQARSLAPFRSIAVNGSTDVAVTVGQPPAVTVEAQPNIAEVIRTTVEGDTLTVSTDRSYRTHARTLVRISVPDLDGVKLDGSADATIDGVHGGSLLLAIRGSGDFTVSGQADELTYECSGSGDGHLDGLQVRSANVRIYGSGDMRLAVSDDLNVHIYGSGDVVYRGSPHVQQTVMGSGSVSGS